MDHANTTGFLFGDDENSAFGPGHNPSEDFPTLVRRNDQMVSEIILHPSERVK